MKLRQIMTNPVIRIHPDETVAVAARILTQYNIGALPVCGGDGKLCGVVTDRDLVIRCMAAGKAPAVTAVREVMTTRVIGAPPDMDGTQAAELMAREQIRRLPVVENGRLCGVVSLGDLAGCAESARGAGAALSDICKPLSSRK